MSVHLDSTGPAYQQRIRAGHHELLADEPAGAGGGDTGPSPYDLVLSGLAACTAMTLRMYADRKGWDIGLIHVDAAFKRTETEETIERRIRLAAVVPEEQRARLAEIAEKTPVTKTLRRGTPITTTFE